MIKAESAALALSTLMCSNMGLHNTQFFTNCQLLVNCINGDNLSDPSDWSIKPFTQAIIASLTGSSKIHKIPRTQNWMAHSLATRGLSSSQSIQASLSTICCNPAHSHGCPIQCALQCVTTNDVMVSTYSCC
jgi:hypothetical protein